MNATQLFDLEQAHKLVELLKAAYPRWRPTNDQAAVWAELLHDLPARAVLAVARDFCLTSKMPPAIAEVREEVRSVMRADAEREAKRLSGMNHACRMVLSRLAEWARGRGDESALAWALHVTSELDQNGSQAEFLPVETRRVLEEWRVFFFVSNGQGTVPSEGVLRGAPALAQPALFTEPEEPAVESAGVHPGDERTGGRR